MSGVMSKRVEFSKSIRRDAFLRANGRCELCGRKLGYGEAEYHHDLEAFLGGEPILSNCIVACAKCHAAITKQRRPAIDKTRRIEEKRMNIRPKSHSMRHPKYRRKMNGEVVARN